MTIKIHKISKDNLNVTGSIDLLASGMSNTSGVSISHYVGTFASTEATLPFEIHIVKEHIPFIKETEFCVVIRERVDLDAIGPKEDVIQEIGNDVGKYDYKASIPSSTLGLPAGFQELYRK